MTVNIKSIKIKSNNITDNDFNNHPYYDESIEQWIKYRCAYEGGQNFINKYTKKFSKRETQTEFNARLESTYCPAHAKVAVNEIKDAISERLVDVERIDGPASYQAAIVGKKGGVDKQNSNMNGFITEEVLPELLSMGAVGVYIDRPVIPARASRADVKDIVPYLYTYTVENILNWKYDDNMQLEKLLLKDCVYTEDDSSGMPNGVEDRYRLLGTTSKGVEVTIYNNEGAEIKKDLLKLKNIPFSLFKIKQALMTDIANYQIALLNLGSSDLSYAIRSNFPFYTEQFDPRDFATDLLKSSGGEKDDGTSSDSNEAHDKNIQIGISQGRRYAKGLDAPAFINPSSEPLEVSMKKQNELQAEIRQLVRLNVTSLTITDDNRSVESGMSCIGLELEKGERVIGKIWAEYTEEEEEPLVKYPRNYTLKTEEERRKEASEIQEQVSKTPSLTLQKILTKQVANILADHRVSKEIMEKIEKEIEDAEVIITDPEVIRADHESGLLGTELASKLRGYPEGEVEKAKKDHVERLARIAEAQSDASLKNAQARGVDDMSANSDEGRNEKLLSRQTDEDEVVTDKTRGGAKDG